MFTPYERMATYSSVMDYKGPSTVSLFLYLILFFVILFAAYYTSRLVSKNVTKRMGNNMEVIEKLPLGVDRSLLVVRIGESFFVLTSDKTGLGKMKRLKGFELNTDQENVGNESFKFATILDKYRK